MSFKRARSASLVVSRSEDDGQYISRTSLNWGGCHATKKVKSCKPCELDLHLTDLPPLSAKKEQWSPALPLPDEREASNN